MKNKPNDFSKDNFINDDEKMRDFFIMNKKSFLASYSYLTEAEYDNTLKILCKTDPLEICRRFYNLGQNDPKIKTEDVPELVGQVIDTFEDFLDKRGIIIPNKERDENENLDPENSANIYGEDYDELDKEIRSTLTNWNIIWEN